MLTFGDPLSAWTTSSPLLFTDTVLHERISTSAVLRRYRVDDDGIVHEVEAELVPFDPTLVNKARRGGLEIARVDGLDWEMNVA